jgi:hypothetical protein
LAFASAKSILDEMACAANLITADGDVPTSRLHLDSRPAETAAVTSSSNDAQQAVLVEEIALTVRTRKTRYSALQPFLPGFQVE